MKFKLLVLVVLSSLAGLSLLRAEVKVSGVFGDNMVLQRDEPIKVWGWADKGEAVNVKFNGQAYKTRATRTGEWEVTLAPMPFGGPYILSVEGKKNAVEFSNILIGEVWLCSGQSNMEWPVMRAANAQQEIDNANFPEIRLLGVTRKMHIIPQDDLIASWQVCSPASVGDFSAVAYFYARELYRKLGIPIGVINTSWGGTDIETWTSSDSYEALPEAVRRQTNMELKEGLNAYVKQHPEGLEGYQEAMAKDKGMAEKWNNESVDVSTWEEMQIPQDWSFTPLSNVDGLVWFRFECEVSKAAAGKPAVLHLGRIDDNDITWINALEVGRTAGYNQNRAYSVPAGTLKAGKNVIAVRVSDDMGPGGFIGQPADLYLDIGSGDTKIPLAGNWKYCTSVINADFNKTNVGPNSLYSLLYNAMIHPFTKFQIKGATWYQGESNAGNAVAYQTLLPNLIENWRTKWGYDFPFYWVQLANFMAKDATPAESSWAELREAQTMTLSTPKTGQAVIIDIGEAGDIHPSNKQEVGRRLALIALNKNYGMDNLIYSGPTFASMEKAGDKVTLTFDTHGSELTVLNKYGYIEGFSIAGADKKFVWARACLKDGKVIVWSDQVKDPIVVRYGWGNNPDINLFNKEGLPAIPFRTDK